jgi:hypothetical protein
VSDLNTQLILWSFLIWSNFSHNVLITPGTAGTKLLTHFSAQLSNSLLAVASSFSFRTSSWQFMKHLSIRPWVMRGLRFCPISWVLIVFYGILGRLMLTWKLLSSACIVSIARCIGRPHSFIHFSACEVVFLASRQSWPHLNMWRYKSDVGYISCMLISVSLIMSWLTILYLDGPHVLQVGSIIDASEHALNLIT